MKHATLYKIDHTLENEVFLTNVNSTISIGKSSSANICFNDWRTSGIHALIKKDAEGNLKIIDLGSLYGTYVNKQKVDIQKLSDGDVINIGSQNVILRMTDACKDHAELINDLDQKIQRDRAKPNYQIASDKTVLEALFYWGDKLLEHKTFDKTSSVTIGDPKRATFGLLLKQFEYEDEIYRLAKYKNGNLILNIPPETQGIVWSEKKPIALDTLRNYDPRFVGKDNIEITLRVGDSAHLEFGEMSLDFKFTKPAEKIPPNLNFVIDKNLQKILAGIFAFYLLIFVVARFWPVEQKEKSLKDIPKRLRKIVYDIGVKNAEERRRAAIGQIAKNLEGGRARAEEGKSKTKKSVTKTAPAKTAPKETVKNTKQSEEVLQNTTKTSDIAATKFEKIDLDSAFSEPTNVKLVAKASQHAKTNVTGNTASAIAGGSFARGKSGYGAGGGGQSVGIGSVSGNLTGGGMGSGDYGLKPSKGRQIDIKEEEEVIIKGGLDPDLIAAIVKRYGPQIQHCYEKGLVRNPKVRGKVTTHFTIAGNGTVISPKIVESTLGDAFTEKCILQKIATWKFPKPKGGGTVGVTWPFILMSNIGN